MNTDRYKYPRTRHLPSSRSRTEDDKVASVSDVTAALNGAEVVVTEKMDGEATTIYADGHSHARSIDSKFHPSRSIVRELSGLISHQLPEGMRICGENIFAVHSIEYKELDSYFQVYNIWQGETCFSWDETVEWCELLNLTHVPVLYRGPWLGEAETHAIWRAQADARLEASEQESEGFVVRPTDGFAREEFGSKVFKWVREKHVQTEDHWMHQAMKVNGVKA